MSKFIFKVDSALLSELGERLVESEHIALVELVKNAYDADATKVIVKINSQKDNQNVIRIIDNGCGMNFEIVQKYWMRIATTNKNLNPVSEKYGRPKTGEKGIGRFSCRKLGEKLILKTTAKNEGLFEYSEIEFDWLRFKAGTDISEIECNGITDSLKVGKTGTELVISKGNSEWNQRKFNYLKRHLAVLVANRGIQRNGFEYDPGFELFIEAPDFNESIIDLRDDLINSGWGTLEATITEDGYAKCTLSALDIGKKEILSSEQFTKLKDIKLKIGIISQRKEQLRNPGITSIGQLKDILNEWGGVQVRYKGFRVYPYGDDDWLEIDKDRGRSLASVKNNQLLDVAKTFSIYKVDSERFLISLLSMKGYVGQVEIGAEADGFEMKVNREGFLESEEFKELKRFVRFAIDWSTIYRDYYLRMLAADQYNVAKNDLEHKLKKNLSQNEVIGASFTFLRDQINAIIKYSSPEEKVKIDNILYNTSNLLIQRDNTLSSQMDRLRLIASTSVLSQVFAHETKSFISTIDSNIIQLNSLMDLVDKTLRPKISHINERLSMTKDRFLHLIDMVSIISQKDSFTQKAKISVRERIEKSIKSFQLIIYDYKIDIDINDIPLNLFIGPIYEAELYAIIINVLSNSIKSVIANKKVNRRMIKFEGYKINSKTKIVILDNGIGLDEENFKEVFIPFISDPTGKLYSNLEINTNPKDQMVLGTGTGLGLSIVKDIVEKYNGKIEFKKPSGNWKAELEIIL